VEKGPDAEERDLRRSVGTAESGQRTRRACWRWRPRYPERSLLQNIAAMRSKSEPDWRCPRGCVRSPEEKQKGRPHFMHAAFGNLRFALS